MKPFMMLRQYNNDKLEMCNVIIVNKKSLNAAFNNCLASHLNPIKQPGCIFLKKFAAKKHYLSNKFV